LGYWIGLHDYRIFVLYLQAFCNLNVGAGKPHPAICGATKGCGVSINSTTNHALPTSGGLIQNRPAKPGRSILNRYFRNILIYG
jgi:hypothetical protein